MSETAIWLETLDNALAKMQELKLHLERALERSQPGISLLKGRTWVQALLNGHPHQLRRELGVQKQVFQQLVLELSVVGHTQSKGITVEEELAIFLHACTTGLSFKEVARRFDRSRATVQKCLSTMIRIFSSPPIYNKYVKLPTPGDSGDQIQNRVAKEPILDPFFKDAIGVIEGMQIRCAPGPSATSNGLGAFRNRREFYSQFCLICCNFNLEFTHVESGWEGSATEAQVYVTALGNGFRAPSGKYYLADVAFPASQSMLVPYSIQHHLLGWEREASRSTDAHDYFNLRHAQLRNTVERTIYLLKRRFKILDAVPGYEVDTQTRTPVALCCIHNIIRRYDPQDVEEDVVQQTTSHPSAYAPSTEKLGDESIAEYCEMVAAREKISSSLWKDHVH